MPDLKITEMKFCVSKHNPGYRIICLWY